MSRIAIVGSCITRDLWPVTGGEVAGLLYVSRTSLPSLFAKPVAGFQPAAEPPAGLRPNQHKALVADLQKTALARLVAFRPTHLIFDFIDERYDLLAIGPSLISRSWELEVSGYLQQPALARARVVPRLAEGCGRLWRDAARELAELVSATPLAEARLILHAARWAEVYRDAAGREHPLPSPQVREGEPADLAAHNALLASYEAAFRAVMPPLSVVEAPDLRIADEGHRWGLSPFHYVPDYYRSIRRQLEALGAPVSADASAPSAPAA